MLKEEVTGNGLVQHRQLRPNPGDPEIWSGRNGDTPGSIPYHEVFGNGISSGVDLETVGTGSGDRSNSEGQRASGLSRDPIVENEDVPGKITQGEEIRAIRREGGRSLVETGSEDLTSTGAVATDIDIGHDGLPGHFKRETQPIDFKKGVPIERSGLVGSHDNRGTGIAGRHSLIDGLLEGVVAEGHRSTEGQSADSDD